MRQGEVLAQLRFQPPLDCGKDVALLAVAELSASGDAVPFGEAGATAGGGRVLGNEDRMPAHRRLATIVGRLGWREALGNEIPSMLENDREPARGEISALLLAQPEAPAKCRALEA